MNAYSPPEINPTLTEVFWNALDQALLKQIRTADRSILIVGDRENEFAASLKLHRPDCEVVSFDLSSTSPIDSGDGTSVGARHPSSFDCIVVNDGLQELAEPLAALRRLAKLLKPTGRLVCTLPNIQHFRSLVSIVAGDFQYKDGGALNASQLRFFGTANIQKLFLDAGLQPNFVDAVRESAPAELLEAWRPVLQYLKLNPAFFAEKHSVLQYICVGEPMKYAPETADGITFIAAVNNLRQLEDNLLASPIFRNSRHEIIPVLGASSAGDALRRGLSLSTKNNPLVVLLHQDIYLPDGWDNKLFYGIALAEKKFGPVGIAGIFGVVRNGTNFERAGKVLDRRTLLDTAHELPAQAISLDEIILAFPVRDGSVVGLDAELGFHMYGSEVCLAARDASQAAVIVEAPCLHNSESGYQLDHVFAESAQRFARKRTSDLPYATTCVEFKGNGQISYW